jgi:protoporphyrinogen oxidase
VAVTAAAPLTAALCDDLREDEKQRLLAIKHLGVVCASLLLKRPLSPFYITNIADGTIPFTAIIEMSALVDRSQFGGRSLVYLPKYLDSNSDYFGRSDEELREEFISGIERMHPCFARADVEAFQVSRVKYLLPVSTLNYSDKVPAVATSVRGLYVINSSQIVNGTLNVNETIRLAEAAAERFADHNTAVIPTGIPVANELVATHS